MKPQKNVIYTANYTVSQKEIESGLKGYKQLLKDAQIALKNKPPLPKHTTRKIVYKDD